MKFEVKSRVKGVGYDEVIRGREGMAIVQSAKGPVVLLTNSRMKMYQQRQSRALEERANLITPFKACIFLE